MNIKILRRLQAAQDAEDVANFFNLEQTMEVHLPTEQETIVEDLVASGRFASPSEVISAGVRLLASAEVLRKEVQIGIEQADRGDLIEHDTVFTQLRAMAKSTAGNGTL